ncbi:hypothetical protein M0812_20677 [Anaeramoeba flamelloides]|uniref:CCAAT-binding factor domain-containing protein n=1 Tax=Anaeramoeba flamelloides TaxID=1746091 RepID=A0AAV7YSV3_9EUKA|nr:hypothetical protein M0812_20677 [Anaeramoeba flamelloides]
MSSEHLKKRLERITFDQRGNLYDKFYSRLTESKKEDLQYVEELKKIPPFPHTSDYNSYKEFEQASNQWKNDFLQSNPKIQLPQSIGTSFYRPFIHIKKQMQELREQSINNNSTSDGLSINSEQNSNKSNSSYQKSPSIIIQSTNQNNNSTDDGDDSRWIEMGKELPNFMEDTNSIIGESEPWSNQIIPTEPDPYSFDTYSEYENAYIKWGQIISNSLETVPPHANEFIELHKITSNKIKAGEKEMKRLNEEEKRNCNNGNLNSSKFNNGASNELNCQKTNYESWLSSLTKNNYLQLPLTGFQSIENLKYDINQNRYRQLKELLNKNNFNINYIEKIYHFNLQKVVNRYEKVKKINKISVNKIIKKTIEKEYENENQDLDLYQKFVSYFNSVKNSIPESLFIKSSRVIGRLIPLNKLELKKYNLVKNNDNDNNNIKKNNKIPKYITNFQNNYIRRNDIADENLIKSNFNSNIHIKKNNLIFIIPNYDLDEKINLNLISKKSPNSKESINKYQCQLKASLKEYTQNRLNLRYSPKKYTKENIDKEFLKHDRIFKKNDEKPKIENLLQIVLLNSNFDIFQDWLKQNTSFNLKLSKNIDTFHSIINKSNIENFLNLFFESSSKKIHSKVAFVLSKLLFSSTGIFLIEQFVKNHNLKSLFSIIYALNYFEDENININLPNINEELNYSKFLWSFNFYPIEMNIILLFYLKKIIKIFEKKKTEIISKKNLEKNLQNILQIYNNVIKKLNEQLLFEPKFITTFIWVGYDNKCKKFSNYYLFLILILLNQKNEKINQYFIDEKIDIRNKIINFSHTKFNHIKTTIKILIKKILKNDLLFRHLINIYRSHSDYLLNDLSLQHITKSNSNNNNNNDNNNNNNNNNNFNNNKKQINNGKKIQIQNIFSYLILKKSCNKLKHLYKNKKQNTQIEVQSNEKEQITFLNDRSFNNLICQLFDVMNEPNKKPLTKLYELIAKMLSKMSKYILIFWNLEISDSNSIKNKRKMDNNFYLEEQSLIKLFQMILLNNQNINSTKLKISLIKILTNIIPDPKIHQFYMNKEDKFYSKIYTFLRNVDDYKLAKYIFKLLFTIIIYNSRAINDLIKNKKLQTFMALISSSSTLPLVSSGLYFLSKMLTITELISKNNPNNKIIYFFNQNTNFKQKIPKIINQIHNTFINFFIQNFMFVKINMVFMKYIKDNDNNNYNSFVCSKLFKVYNIILTKPYCNKIRKKNKKKEQYKEGILFFENIYIAKGFEKKSNDASGYDTNGNDKNDNKSLDNKKSKKKFKRWFNKN